MDYAFVLACGMNLFSYWFSDKMVLTMYGAKEVPETDDTALVRTVRRLGAQGEYPDAARVHDRFSGPECFCDGTQPSACGGGGDHAAFSIF